MADDPPVLEQVRGHRLIEDDDVERLRLVDPIEIRCVNESPLLVLPAVLTQTIKRGVSASRP